MRPIVKFLVGVVAISNLSSCKEVFQPSQERTKVNLVSPQENAILRDSLVNFFWEPVDSFGVSYELQLVAPGFDSISQLVVDTVVQRNLLSLHIKSGRYQWRVRAYNNSSSTANSESFTFTIN